jgi:putative YhdH/YhfP family quinone oxidoreductase
MADTFKALVVSEESDGAYAINIKDRSFDELPEGEVLINVKYSSLNFKDALSATGNKGVTRNYPHTPGIDAAGVVTECSDGSFKEGDEVLVTGYDLGMNTSGGYGQYIRVPSGWVVALPEGLSLRESMGIGTAGFTAALSVDGLLKSGLSDAGGEVLVTGATGGVGSLAVSMLAAEGLDVVASTGKAEAEDWLKSIGAHSVIGRAELSEPNKRPLLKGVWAGAVDTVGGEVLANVLKSMKYGASVTCCGLVASMKLDITVLPFILNGVSLIGIDSVKSPMPLRQEIWQKLGGKWKPARLDEIIHESSLDGLEDEVKKILKGGQRGRVVVKL